MRGSNHEREANNSYFYNVFLSDVSFDDSIMGGMGIAIFEKLLAVCC
jgi:hypothetical protein